MDKPKTNREALRLVVEICGNQSKLAERLGVVRQLVSRWDEIPPKYLHAVAGITQLPISWILPELESSVSALIGRPSELLLPELIRLLHPDTKGSPWPAPKRTPKKSKKIKRT